VILSVLLQVHSSDHNGFGTSFLVIL
jgi:hypothetical protein